VEWRLSEITDTELVSRAQLALEARGMASVSNAPSMAL